MTTTTVHRTDVRLVQRRTVLLLMLGEILGSVALTVGFAVVGILAAQLAGSTGAVGFTQASQTVGAAVASYALAAWMNQQGRRRGLAVGYLIGALGAASCMAAAATGSFLLLVAGAVALGSASASGSLSRYASTDLASPSRRATTLSLVVWTATAGAVAGPLMVPAAEGWARHLGMPPLAGPFGLAMVCTGAAAVLLFVFLRPDPLLLAREIERPTAPSSQPGPAATTPVRALAPTIAALVCAHTTMVAVMVMTPIDMHHGGSSHQVIGVAVSMHFLGMFALAPLSGLLADRCGVRPALGIGGVVLALSLAVLAGLFGTTSTTHAVGMFALGLGWSLATVAATSHIAACSHGDTRIQGIAETTMACVSAAAAAASGPLMAIWGFDALLALALLLTAGLFVATAQIRLRPAPGQVTADQEVPTSTHGIREEAPR
jgi:MFS family permease